MLNALSHHLSMAEAVVTVSRQWMGWKLKIWVSQIVGTPKKKLTLALGKCIMRLYKRIWQRIQFEWFVFFLLSGLFIIWGEFCSHQQLAWFGMLCQQELQLIESVTAQRARKSVYQLDSMIQNVAVITLVWNVSCPAFLGGLIPASLFLPLWGSIIKCHFVYTVDYT